MTEAYRLAHHLKRHIIRGAEDSVDAARQGIHDTNRQTRHELGHIMNKAERMKRAAILRARKEKEAAEHKLH